MADVREDFSDLLDDESPVSEAVVKEPQKEEQAVPAKVEPVNTEVGKVDFQFDELLNLPGAAVIDVGTRVSALPVERIKFTEESKARISFISDKIVAIRTHFVEGLGNIICNGGKCCDLYGAPKVRYLAPVIQYTTDKKGAPISKEVECKCLCLAGDSYESIATSLDEFGTLLGCDFIVTCSDANYQKCSFTRTKEALWMKSKSITEEVSKFWKENIKYLVKAVAREVKDEQLGVAPPTTVKDVDLDEVFKDE